MKKSRLLGVVSAIIITIILGVSGCGGSGGGGGGGATTIPTNPDQLFSLETVNSMEPGTIYTAQLTGSDSNDVNLTGSISLANRAQIMLGGVLVTPSDLILSVTDGDASVTITGTSFVDTSGNLISLTIQTTGVTCTPVSPDTMPTSVIIGDFGILSTLVCDDNTMQERSWRVVDGGNGTIRIISNATSKDQFSNIVSIGDVTFTIDSNGDILAIKVVSTDVATNYTLTMQSI